MKMVWLTALAALLVTFLTVSPGLGLTADQVLKLKGSGISDKTIQLMIAQEREAEKHPGDKMGVREIRDGDGNVAVVHSTGHSQRVDYSEQERQKLDKAWELLRNVIVDGRK